MGRLLSDRPVICAWLPAPSSCWSTANCTLLGVCLEAAAQPSRASSPTLNNDAKLNWAQNKEVRRTAGLGKCMHANLSRFIAYLCGFLKFTTFR